MIMPIITHLTFIFLLCCFLFWEKEFPWNKTSKSLSILGVSIIALGLQYYVVGVYYFFGAIALILDLNKLRFDKTQLKREHHFIDAEILPVSFELKIHHIVFLVLSLGIAFFFNVFIGVFYALFIFFGFLGGLVKYNIYRLIPQKAYIYVKGLRKDQNTMRYHWGTKYLFFKIFNRLSLIAILVSLTVLILVLPIEAISESVLFSNFYELGILSCIVFFGSFLLDLYIILFGNASIFNKFGMFCYRCAAFSAVRFLFGNGLEKQLLANSFDRLGYKW